MEAGVMFGIIAALTQTVAYVDYNQQVFRGKTSPNGATWAIWASIALISTSSYLIMTGDLAKSALSLVNSFLCIGTFALALYLKRFERPDASDWLALGIGMVAVYVWYHYRSATYANLTLQVSILIGFIPTYRLVWKSPEAERPRPWYLWSLAYVFLLATIGFRWKGQAKDLVYPVNCLFLHLLVPVFGKLSRMKQAKIQNPAPI